MRWLLVGTLSSSVAEALKTRGDQVLAASELGLEPGDLQPMLSAARERQLDVITADPAVASAAGKMEKPLQRSVVYLQLPGEDVEQSDAVDRLFARYKRLTPGRLYTVTANRVKVRQLGGSFPE